VNGHSNQIQKVKCLPAGFALCTGGLVLNAEANTGHTLTIVRHLRSATSGLHRHLERTLDIIAGLSDPVLGPELIRFSERKCDQA
jgi:hypothetical protein